MSADGITGAAGTASGARTRSAGVARYTFGMSVDRLQKVLARAGIASRRKSEELISAGRVTVDGRVATLGDTVSGHERIVVDGQVVEPRERHRTFALHKPPGVVTTASDERGRPTVMDFVPDVPGLHPVGRLDMDSEGLLLLSTDGELTLRLTHPRYEHEKEYRVWCAQGRVDERDVQRWLEGVELDDGPARALEARPLTGGALVVLHEGRNRQVRRMLEARGYTVERLLRTRIGGWKLGDLEPGAWHELTAEDLVTLGYTRGPDRPDRNAGPPSEIPDSAERTPRGE